LLASGIFILGDIVSSKKDIHLSYKSALEYVNYKLFYGWGSIISFAMIK